MNESQVSTIDDVVETKKPRKAPEAKAESNGKRQMLTIHSSSDDNGSDAVFVGVNEYAYQIPRDKPFEVPSEVVDVLRNAVTTKLRPGSNGGVVERTLPRYNFTAVPV